MGPGFAVTLPQGQLRPYAQLWPYPQEFYGRVNVFWPYQFYGRVNVFWPYQGSAATLPDLSVKNPAGFYIISKFEGFMVLCLRFLAWRSCQPMLSMIQVQVQHSFYQKHSFYQNVPPLLATHAFNDSGYQGSSATPTWFPFIKIPPPPLGNPCFQWFRLPGDPTWLPFIKIFASLAAHAFNYNIPFIKNIPLSKISPPFGSPCFQWFRLPGVICEPTWLPFIKISAPPWQPMLSNTTFLWSKTFLLSKFPSPPLGNPCFQWFRFPSWQHMLSMIQVTRGHLQPYLTSFYQHFPPRLGSPCFQLQHSFYQKFPPPLAAHAFNDWGYQGSSATLPNFFIHVQCRTEVGSHNTPYSHT